MIEFNALNLLTLLGSYSLIAILFPSEAALIVAAMFMHYGLWFAVKLIFFWWRKRKATHYADES